MIILGIIAEYDPFHLGHEKHLQLSRSIVRPDFTYVAVSPCFKQRGDLSLLSPTDRARCAVIAGADAVFSLPVLWTLRDAEHYALGAVSLLYSLGITHLAFGAESDDTDLLNKIAFFLENPTQKFCEKLHESLSSGCGYPRALSDAVSFCFPEARHILSSPNNILAVCYLRTMIRLKLPVTPVIIRRTGSYRADLPDPLSPSASSVREALLRGSWKSALSSLPDYTRATVQRAFLSRHIPDSSLYSALVLSRLRSMTRDQASLLPDISEGLDANLLKNAACCTSLTDLSALMVTRRYPASRILRLFACAALQLSSSDFDKAPLPDCAFLLAMRKNKNMTSSWKDLSIPVVSSLRDIKNPLLSEAEKRSFSLWSFCSSLPESAPYTERITVV